MKKIFLIALLGLFLVSCKKNETITEKSISDNEQVDVTGKNWMITKCTKTTIYNNTSSINMVFFIAYDEKKRISNINNGKGNIFVKYTYFNGYIVREDSGSTDYFSVKYVLNDVNQIVSEVFEQKLPTEFTYTITYKYNSDGTLNEVKANGVSHPEYEFKDGNIIKINYGNVSVKEYSHELRPNNFPFEFHNSPFDSSYYYSPFSNFTPYAKFSKNLLKNAIYTKDNNGNIIKAEYVESPTYKEVVEFEYTLL